MSGFKTDKQIIRDYITAADHLQYTQLPEGTVAILMTHSNLPSKHVDIRLSLHSTIYEVKEKFRTHIGTPPDHQRLVLKENGQVIGEMPDDHRKLGFYSVQSGMEIHIVDTDPYSLSRNGGLSDVSLVEKYKLSDEAYDQRKGTMREYIREQRKKNPNFKVGVKAPNGQQPETEEPKEIPGPESVEGITVDSRCEVKPGERRGTVRFVGEIPEIPSGGFWVGVQFDEPLGHNDGSVKGRTIFECQPGFGAFVRGHNITVGDFPERDPFASDDEDDHKDCQHHEHEEDEI